MDNVIWLYYACKFLIVSELRCSFARDSEPIPMTVDCSLLFQVRNLLAKSDQIGLQQLIMEVVDCQSSYSKTLDSQAELAFTVFWATKGRHMVPEVVVPVSIPVLTLTHLLQICPTLRRSHQFLLSGHQSDAQVHWTTKMLEQNQQHRQSATLSSKIS